MKRFFGHVVENRHWYYSLAIVALIAWVFSSAAEVTGRDRKWFRDCLGGNVDACRDCAAFATGPVATDCLRRVP